MEWLAPWYSVADDAAQAAGMEQELRRELAAGHPLYGVPVRTLGRNGDDVLFAVEDGSGRVAVVHLTWIQSAPDRPPWPDTAFYPSLQAWAADGMRSDHEDSLMTEAEWLACGERSRCCPVHQNPRQ